MNWYLRKKDGTVYGPVDVEALRDWAAAGRVAPEDQVSADQSAWRQAPSLSELAMDWMIDLPGHAQAGPYHLLALAGFIRDGAVRADARILNRLTGERRVLGAELLPVLLEQAAPAPAAAAEAAGDAAAVALGGKDVLVRRDAAEREARKWKQMYEQERDQASSREADLTERLRVQRESELDTLRRFSNIEQKLRLIEQSVALSGGAADSSAPGSAPADVLNLLESYQALSQNYDRLLAQTQTKSEELKTTLEGRAALSRELAQNYQRMEELLRREQEESDRLRLRLAELEETHLHVVRAYRDLNDRFIRLRQQQEAALPSRRVEAPRLRVI